VGDRELCRRKGVEGWVWVGGSWDSLACAYKPGVEATDAGRAQVNVLYVSRTAVPERSGSGGRWRSRGHSPWEVCTAIQQSGSLSSSTTSKIPHVPMRVILCRPFSRQRTSTAVVRRVVPEWSG